LWEVDFHQTDFALIFAEESSHARFELFPSSQSILLRHILVFPGSGACVHRPRLQPVRPRLASLCQKVWLAVLGLP
jgi:hypothetical protein